MKKVYLVLSLTALSITSCDSIDSGANGDKLPLGNRTVQVMEFEGCEYVYLRRYGSVSITHKGNCNNNIHNN